MHVQGKLLQRQWRSSLPGVLRGVRVQRRFSCMHMQGELLQLQWPSSLPGMLRRFQVQRRLSRMHVEMLHGRMGWLGGERSGEPTDKPHWHYHGRTW